MSEDVMTDKEWNDIFDPLTKKYFDAAEIAGFEQRHATWDPAEVSAAWAGLIGECRALMDKADPTSPEAKDLARRWMAQVEAFTGGNPTLQAKSAAMWKDATTDPLTAPKLPINTEMFAFISKAEAARKAMG